MKLEISSDELVRRVMFRLHMRHKKANMHPFWATVGDVFAIGSTSACALCRWAGYDPDTAKKLEETK